MTVFTNLSDLKTWIDHALGNEPDVCDDDIEAMVDAILLMPTSPAWGTDWGDFLASDVPDNLWDLIAN